MKLAIALLVASTGTCSVGGTTRLPPSPAEQASPGGAASNSASSSAPDAAATPECAALAAPCTDCTDVELMRREIEYRKCLPVCSTYVEQSAALGSASPRTRQLLQSPTACGKGEETCSPTREVQCEYMIGYVTSSERFVQRMRTEVVDVEQLPDALVHDLLLRYLEHHSRVNSWASSNNLDPDPLLELGGELFSDSQELAEAMIQRLRDAGYPRVDAINALIDLARNPRNPETFEMRRAEAEHGYR